MYKLNDSLKVDNIETTIFFELEKFCKQITINSHKRMTYHIDKVMILSLTLIRMYETLEKSLIQFSVGFYKHAKIGKS